MAYGVFSHRFLQFVALALLMLCMTQAQETQETATTDSADQLSDLSEQTTLLVTDPSLGETTTEIPATVDVVPAIETENRNAQFDLSAAADLDTKDSNEIYLDNVSCESDAIGFEIVTG